MNRGNQSPRPDWSGRTTVIFGGGPSLTDEQVAYAHGKRVDGAGVKIIGVSGSIFGTFCDVGYSGDFMFFKTYAERLRKECSPKLLWTCDKTSAERWGLSWVKGVNRDGLGREGTINMLGNSGAQGIQLAYLFGARRIVLLGFDMRLGPKGEKHHHPDHPAPCVQEQLFEEWIHKMRPLASDLALAGCEVFNCTPGSALPWFAMATLEETLR